MNVRYDTYHRCDVILNTNHGVLFLTAIAQNRQLPDDAQSFEFGTMPVPVMFDIIDSVWNHIGDMDTDE